MSENCRYCCKSRKSNGSDNLAKVDFQASLPLPSSVGRYEGSSGQTPEPRRGVGSSRELSIGCHVSEKLCLSASRAVRDHYPKARHWMTISSAVRDRPVPVLYGLMVVSLTALLSLP